jgi:hypothetical protein
MDHAQKDRRQSVLKAARIDAPVLKSEGEGDVAAVDR